MKHLILGLIGLCLGCAPEKNHELLYEEALPTVLLKHADDEAEPAHDPHHQEYIIEADNSHKQKFDLSQIERRPFVPGENGMPPYYCSPYNGVAPAVSATIQACSDYLADPIVNPAGAGPNIFNSYGY